MANGESKNRMRLAFSIHHSRFTIHDLRFTIHGR